MEWATKIMGFEGRDGGGSKLFPYPHPQWWKKAAVDWVDKNLPQCPFCRNTALWEIKLEYKIGFNRYHYRCINCKSIVSISVGAVSGFSVFSDKSLKIEEVTGNCSSLQNLQGTKQSLKTLQSMAKA